MRTDGIFTTYSKCIQVKKDVPIRFIPIGDIHADSELHADKEFDEFLEYLKSLKDKYYLFGMGDYLDFARAHERAIMEHIPSKNGDKALNEYVLHAIDGLAEKLEFTTGNWLGMLGGNHFFNIVSTKRGSKESIHSDKLLAEKLKTCYLGVCSRVTLTLTSGKCSCDLGIITHHGIGGGATPGGGMNRVSKFLYAWDAQIALMGDNHQRGVLPVGDKLGTTRVDSDDVIFYKTQWVARTGGFQRGYARDIESYVVDKAMNPSSIGWIEFELTLKTNLRTGMPYIKIRAIQ